MDLELSYPSYCVLYNASNLIRRLLRKSDKLALDEISKKSGQKESELIPLLEEAVKGEHISVIYTNNESYYFLNENQKKVAQAALFHC